MRRLAALALVAAFGAGVGLAGCGGGGTSGKPPARTVPPTATSGYEKEPFQPG